MLDLTQPPSRPLGRGVRALCRALLSPWGRCALLAAVLAVATYAVLASDLERLLTTGWPRHLSGAVAALTFAAVYAACTLAFVPKPLLNAAAGALFGIQYGLLAAVAGTTLGALAAFVLGRVLGRDALRSLLRTRALKVMDRQLSEHGFRSVLLMRLVPGVPFAVGNYSAAVSGARCASFVAGTALGVVPNTVVYVVAGSRATTPDSPAFVVALTAICVMSVLSVLVLWRARRRARALADAATG